MDRTGTIAAVCALLKVDNTADAAAMLQREYPFVSLRAVERKYGEAEAIRVFVRDGFLDRYSGKPLVFQGVLRLLSLRFPEQFPFHPNWKMSETHVAFWELSPTILITWCPLPGEDLMRSTIGLRLRSFETARKPIGRSKNWDGMLGWLVAYVAAHEDAMTNPLVRRWYRAALSVPSS